MGQASATTQAAAPVFLRSTTGERILQAAVATGLAAAIGLGLVLAPSPAGTGTHTQLGLPPCGLLVATGHPCPTCGVTTSFVLAAHGRFHDALVNQPFGLLVFLLMAAGLATALATLVMGRSWLPHVTPYRVLALVLALMALGAASWAYKWMTM